MYSVHYIFVFKLIDLFTIYDIGILTLRNDELILELYSEDGKFILKLCRIYLLTMDNTINLRKIHKSRGFMSWKLFSKIKTFYNNLRTVTLGEQVTWCSKVWVGESEGGVCVCGTGPPPTVTSPRDGGRTRNPGELKNSSNW